MTMTAALTTSKLCARQWVQVQGHRTTGGKASRPGQAPTHSGRRLARRNVTQMKGNTSSTSPRSSPFSPKPFTWRSNKRACCWHTPSTSLIHFLFFLSFIFCFIPACSFEAFESDKKGSSSSSSSFSRSLAVAGLSAMLLLQAQTADAKVVLKQSEAKKVSFPLLSSFHNQMSETTTSVTDWHIYVNNLISLSSLLSPLSFLLFLYWRSFNLRLWRRRRQKDQGSQRRRRQEVVLPPLSSMPLLCPLLASAFRVH